MKKIIMFLLLAVVFVSCSKSPEQKANKLIKEDLQKSLFKPDTYQATETKIDSAFSPYADPEFIELAIEYFDINDEMEDYQNTMKWAKSKMTCYTPSPTHSNLFQYEYDKAKERYDEASLNYKKAQKKLEKKAASMNKMLSEKPKFIGYAAYHTYRADNNAGNTLIGHAFYIFDKDIKNILVAMEVDDIFKKSNYSKLQAVIKQIEEGEEEEYEEVEKDEE